MPKIITPARLTAGAGVATGLAAAATSLAGVFTTGSSIGNAIVTATGLLTTAASVFKFLAGQSAWEVAVQKSDATAALVGPSAHVDEPVVFEPDFSVGDATNSAELDGGEQPLTDVADEPARLQAQLPATDAPAPAPPAAEEIHTPEAIGGSAQVPLAGGSI